MLGKAHMAIGFSLGLLLTKDVSEAWLVIPVTTIAAVLPDILDAKHSSGRNPLGLSWSSIRRTRAQRNKSIVDWTGLILRTILAWLLDCITRIIPHRGLTHWLITWLAFSALVSTGISVWHNNLTIALGFALGYLSHLIADSFTVSGVALLSPFHRASIHLLPRGLRFRYDSVIQWVIVFVVLGIVLLIKYLAWSNA